MEPTIKAILAKHGGSKTLAVAYCYSIIDTHPHLRAEYTAIIDAILEAK